MITCSSIVYSGDAEPGDNGAECGAPATQRVTVTGADRAKGVRSSSTPTPWNLDRAPRCDRCAKLDRGIVTRLFPPSATFDSEPIA